MLKQVQHDGLPVSGPPPKGPPCASSPTMRRRPAPRCWRRSPTPTGSTPPMTATAGAPGSTTPSRTCSRPEVTALWVATGTAANALALAALCPPYGSIVCHRDAHIQNDECGAPEFYTNGAKLLLGEGEGAKLTPATVTALLETVRNDVHQTQPAALSITNATEYGLVYTAEETAALGRAGASAGARLPCRRRPLRQCRRQRRRVAGRPDLAGRSRRAQLRLRQEWRDFGRGPDLLRRPRTARRPCTGASAPAISCPRAAIWPPSSSRCSRTGCGCATPAPRTNAAARLAEAAGPTGCVLPVEANEIFLKVTPAEAQKLRDQGFDFYDWGPGEARLVTAGIPIRSMSRRSPPRSGRCERRPVIPAKAGTSGRTDPGPSPDEAPAFAGVTGVGETVPLPPSPPPNSPRACSSRGSSSRSSSSP